jgi:dihydroneopterin aldolase
MTVTVNLETMTFHAFHGVAEQERIIGGTFLADVSYVAETKAVETDLLEDTVSYSDVFDIVKAEMNKPSKLIEHVAGRIMSALKSNFPQIKNVTVRISKLNPPVHGEVGKASVKIETSL